MLLRKIIGVISVVAVQNFLNEIDHLYI